MYLLLLILYLSVRQHKQLNRPVGLPVMNWIRFRIRYQTRTQKSRVHAHHHVHIATAAHHHILIQILMTRRFHIRSPLFFLFGEFSIPPPDYFVNTFIVSLCFLYIHLIQLPVFHTRPVPPPWLHRVPDPPGRINHGIYISHSGTQPRLYSQLPSIRY